VQKKQKQLAEKVHRKKHSIAILMTVLAKTYFYRQICQSGFYHGKNGFIHHLAKSCQPCRKVLPADDCTRSVSPAHMQQRPLVPFP